MAVGGLSLRDLAILIVTSVLSIIIIVYLIWSYLKGPKKKPAKIKRLERYTGPIAEWRGIFNPALYFVVSLSSEIIVLIVGGP